MRELPFFHGMTTFADTFQMLFHLFFSNAEQAFQIYSLTLNAVFNSFTKKNPRSSDCRFGDLGVFIKEAKCAPAFQLLFQPLVVCDFGIDNTLKQHRLLVPVERFVVVVANHFVTTEHKSVH